MEIHGIFSSYLGDDEFDVGKALRRNEAFFDTEFVLDLSDGHRTRIYIVDWAKSFPDVQSAYYQHSPQFFEPGGAEEWRRISFEKADKAWSYDDDDWICFVDCTEGMSIDGSLDLLPFDPADPAGGDPNLFRPWLEAEIEATSRDHISFPIYAFIGYSPVWINHVALDEDLQDIIDTMTDDDIYLSMTKAELNMVNHTKRQECYQSWTRAGWSQRMFKVSALKDVDFDWSVIDTFVSSAPADRVTLSSAIVSYAYARWAHDPARIDRTDQRPMTEADDDGWRVRQRMSQVRPVTGLPFDDWDNADISGRTAPHDPPPPSVVPVEQAYSSAFNDDFANFDAGVPTRPGSNWASYDPIMTLYPEVLRQNRRESLFFLEDQLGPEPWNFYTGQPALTAAQRIIRATQPVNVMEPPRIPVTSYRYDDVPTTTPLPPHPDDTIHPDEIPPTEEGGRPKWNEGKWNEGEW